MIANLAGATDHRPYFFAHALACRPAHRLRFASDLHASSLFRRMEYEGAKGIQKHMKTSTCTLLSLLVMASIGCSSATRMPPTNQDPRWDEDSRPLETIFQWLGRKQGITYVLNPKLEVLGMRIIPEWPKTSEKFLHDLTHLYRLQFKPLANGKIEVVPMAPMSFYEQFTDPPLPGNQDRIRL